MTWSFTDNVGVRTCYATLTPPNSGDDDGATQQPPIRLTASVPSNLVSGSALSGVLRRTFTLPRGSAQGTWTVTNAYCIENNNLRGVFNGSSALVQTGRGDTSAPQIVGASLSPSTVDTTSQTATVTVSVMVKDDFSGVTSCYVYLGSPAYPTSSRVSASVATLANGTRTNGMLTGRLSLGRNSEKGTWPLVRVQCTDGTGKTTRLTGDQLSGAGFFAGLEQTGNYDSEPPKVLGVSLTPSEIDTSQRSATVNGSVTFTDNFGISYCYIYLSKSGSSSVRITANRLASGSNTSGVLSGLGTFPRLSSAGAWAVTSVYCRDAAGRSVSLSGTNLAAFSPPSVNQTGTGDDSAPTLNGLAISPSTVDTSRTSARISFYANVCISNALPRFLSLCGIALRGLEGTGVSGLA